MQQRQEPIEGNDDSEAIVPTRTGDDVPTSVVTPREARTMGLVPFVFGGVALLVAAVVMVIFIVAR